MAESMREAHRQPGPQVGAATQSCQVHQIIPSVSTQV